MTNIKVTNMKKYSREICYCLSCPKWSVWNLDEKQPGLGCTPDLSRYSRPFCPTFIESSCGHSLSRSGIIVPSSPCLPLSSSTMTSGCASTHTGWATFASIYLFKVHNVFFQISNCICPNCEIYLFKLQNVFVQIKKVFVQISKCICPNCWCLPSIELLPDDEWVCPDTHRVGCVGLDSSDQLLFGRRL